MNVSGKTVGSDRRGWLPAVVSFGVFAVVWVSRWPFLGPGVGDDADAWRVAEAARMMHATGVFHSSRVPGHPVSDAICGWLYPFGPLALTGFTALLSALAVLFFYQWLRKADARNPLFCAAALAFLPAYFVSSTTALDMVWAFAFMMAALLAAMRGRAFPAGVLLGLAIGCRNTSGAFLIPMGIVLYSRQGVRHPVRSVAILSAVSILTGALTYLPVYRGYGVAYLLHHWEDPYPTWPVRLAYSLYEFSGLAGGLAILLLLGLRATGRLDGPPPEGRADRGLLVAAFSGIALYVTAFLVLPHEGIYLLPAVPLGLYILDRHVLGTRAMLVMAAAMLVSSLLVSIEPVLSPEPGDSAASLTFRIRNFDLAIDWRGPVLAERASRKAGVAYTDRILDALLEREPPVALVAGRWQPMLDNRLSGRRPDASGEQVAICYLIEQDKVADYRDRGYRLYYLPYQKERNLAMYGVDLEAEGMLLPLD